MDAREKWWAGSPKAEVEDLRGHWLADAVENLAGESREEAEGPKHSRTGTRRTVPPPAPRSEARSEAWPLKLRQN